MIKMGADRRRQGQSSVAGAAASMAQDGEDGAVPAQRACSAFDCTMGGSAKGRIS
jgi:hypothetical protein